MLIKKIMFEIPHKNTISHLSLVQSQIFQVIKRKSINIKLPFHNFLRLFLVRQVFCFCSQFLVVVNTVVEAGTLSEIAEDVVEPDQEEDGGGGHVDTAGSPPDPSQGSQETELGGEARTGQFIVQSDNPRQQADHRPDDGGSVTPENSGQGGEEDTSRVLVLNHPHPRHDLSHPLHLLDTPQEAEHNRMFHKLEDPILPRYPPTVSCTNTNPTSPGD